METNNLPESSGDASGRNLCRNDCSCFGRRGKVNFSHGAHIASAGYHPKYSAPAVRTIGEGRTTALHWSLLPMLVSWPLEHINTPYRTRSRKSIGASNHALIGTVWSDCDCMKED